MKGVVIMGFPKCGTTSLLKYLEKKENLPIQEQSGLYDHGVEGKISRREWCYLPFEETNKLFNNVFGNIEDYKLVFITRDPVERIWSGWEAWRHYYAGYMFEQYLQLDTKEYNKRNPGKGLSYLGEISPIKQVDYHHYIQPFISRGLDVVIFKLEEIRKDPAFPQTNSLKKEPVPDDKRKLIEYYLKKNK